jgi:hypothetical protein
LNLVVNVHATVWREILRGGRNEELRDRVSNMTRTDDDTEYIENIQEAGRRYEERLREKKADAGSSKFGSKSLKPEKKGNPSTDLTKPQNADNRGSKKRGKGKGKEKAKPEDKKSNKTQCSKGEALKGIDPKLVETRQRENLCMRCGKDGHRWCQCQGDIVKTSARKVAGQKRRIPEEAIQAEDEEAHLPADKRRRIAARWYGKCKGGAHGDGWRASTAGEGWRNRITEMDSEEEVD